MLRNFLLEIIGSKLKRYVTGDYVKNKLTILRKCLHTDPDKRTELCKIRQYLSAYYLFYKSKTYDIFSIAQFGLSTISYIMSRFVPTITFNK